MKVNVPRMNFVRVIKFFVLTSLLFLLTACAPDIRVDIGEKFTLQQGESARIRHEPLFIALEVAGVEWVEAEEIPFAEISVRHKGQNRNRMLYIGDDWQLGDYVISITRVNPFGKSAECEIFVQKQ